MDGDSQLLDEVLIGSARGGRRAAEPLEVEVVRSLTEADIPALLNPEKLPALQAPRSILEIRHHHHMLAQCMAAGHPQEMVSRITGYSPSYISTIKNDPAFAELLAYYGQQKSEQAIDALERLRSLGLAGVEELQRRMDAEPEKRTWNEILEMVDKVLVKPLTGPAVGPRQGGAAGGVSIKVEFVTAAEQPAIVTIEGEGREVAP